MKLLSVVASAVLALATSIQASGEVSPINNLDVQLSFPGSFSTPEGAFSLTNDEETAVAFRITNGESSPLVLAAYGGAIYDKKDDKAPYTNLTTTSISPVQIAPGETTDITQAIRVALPPKEFDVAFTLYFSFNDEILTVTLSKTPITVNDPPVSNLDPKLLFVQVVLGLTAIVGGYFASVRLILPAIEKKYPTTPVAAAATAETKKKSSDGKSYDESWIPEHHLRKNKKKQ